MSHALKYEYEGGVLPHEKYLCERFEDEIMPYVTKYGPYIGQLAMMGDKNCEEILLRHNGFLRSGPEQRKYNYTRLVRCLRTFKAQWHEVKKASVAMTGGQTLQ